VVSHAACARVPSIYCIRGDFRDVSGQFPGRPAAIEGGMKRALAGLPGVLVLAQGMGADLS
jgi:hypothetical protein